MIKWKPEIVVRGEQAIYGEAAVYGNRKFRLLQTPDGVKLLAAPYHDHQRIRVYRQLFPISVLYDMDSVKEIFDEIMEHIPDSLFGVNDVSH